MEKVGVGVLNLDIAGNKDATTMVNGTNAHSPPTAGGAVGFRHNLPQIPTMTRTKIAQSKASIKKPVLQKLETATLHIEGTSKIVKLTSDEEQKEKIMEVEEVPSKAEIDRQTQKKGNDKKKSANNKVESAADKCIESDIDNGKNKNDVSHSKKSTVENNDVKVANSAVKRNEVCNRRKGGTERRKSGRCHIEKVGQDVNLELGRTSENMVECKEIINVGTVMEIESHRSRLVTGEQPTDSTLPLHDKKRERKSKSVSDPVTPTLEVKEDGKRQRKQKSFDFELEANSKKLKPEKEVNVVATKQQTVVDEQKLPKWLVGDLLWAKVSGHPFWPCMVSYDPFQSLYTRLQARFRQFHVQFFGDEAERGWVSESATMSFEGKDKFFEHSEEVMKNATKKQKSKLHAIYKVNPGRVRAWTIAITSAELALPMSRNERKQNFTFTYEIPQVKVTITSDESTENIEKSLTYNGQVERTPKKRGRKRKLGEIVNVSENETTPDTKRVKLEKSEDESGRSHVHHPRSSVVEGSFEVFFDKHKDDELLENPDFDDKMLTETLEQQWQMMHPKQKARYKCKFSADSPNNVQAVVRQSERISKPVLKTEASEEGKRSPRTPKPSLKRLEAEEDNKIFSEFKRQSRQKKSLSRSPEVGSQSQNSTVDAESGQSCDTKSETSASEEMEQKQKSKELLPAHKRVKRENSASSSCSGSETQEETIQSCHPIPRRSSKDEDYELEIFKLTSTGPQKKENLCIICEKTGDLIECEGPCQSYFHTDCLGLSTAPTGSFKCDECQTGNHTCFCCKNSGNEMRKCGVPACGKFYHEECANKLPQTRREGKGNICPLHTCATCFAENSKNPKATKGRLLRCVRCPTAYHVGDMCIAAGSDDLPGYYIVCSKHFTPDKSHKHHGHFNVSWCFICSKGGTLLCCESCPAAFHAECLKLDFPEGSWYCNDCAAGKMPLYGEIIWIKLGNYRWWPSEICHPRNIPTNILHMTHKVGEFPVRFFGSHDFFWSHRGRVFLFQEGDKGSRDYTTAKGLAKIFQNGLKEATEAYKKWKAVKDSKEQQEIERNDKKPAPFKFIRTNFPIEKVEVRKADLAEITRCECTTSQDNPCGPDSECLNRMLMYECHSALCPAKEKCQNQRFTKRQYPHSEPFKTSARGWGLRTLVDIKKGHFVNEYVGDLIDEEEVKNRVKLAHEENVTNFYMLTLDKDRIIDAGPKGNLSRFMNHSCNPNCETQKWMVNGDVRVGLFALHDIAAGCELTFNYNFECLGNDKTKCVCEASNCSGYLGVKPKSASELATEKRAKDSKMKKKRKKHKPDARKDHEDECFRCNEGGELVMCDRSKCPKVYHIQCLNLNKPPHGKWDCPWHHCDVCGKVAVKLCSDCPNSFCSQHIEGNIFEVRGRLFCSDHDDIIEGRVLPPSSSVSSVTSSDHSDTETSKLESSSQVNAPIKASTDTNSNNSSNNRSQKSSNGRRSKTSQKRKSSTGGGRQGYGQRGDGTSTRSQLDDPLAVAPMFDDSDEEFPDLVIDIPNF